LEFQGITDLIDYFAKQYADQPGFHEIISEAVRESFEQVLIESIAGSLSLKNRPHWNDTDFAQATSKEALTTAVMPRYWMVSHVKRLIGVRGRMEA